MVSSSLTKQRQAEDKDAWNAYWQLRDLDSRGTVFPRIRYYAHKAFDAPATWFRESIVEPMNNRNRLPYYQRKLSRVPEIDECGVNDKACFFEANEQFRLDKMVDGFILQTLRGRVDRCINYNESSNLQACAKVIEDLEENELNFFIKYGELGSEADVRDAYMKQKHRLIWERRHPEIMEERKKALKEHKEKLEKGEFDFSFWKKNRFWQDKKNYEPPYEFYLSKSTLEGDKPLSKDWQYYKKVAQDPEFDKEQGKSSEFHLDFLNFFYKQLRINDTDKYKDGDEENIEPVDVFCVDPSDPSISKDEVEYLRDTFTMLNDCGVGVEWLSEEKALEVLSKSDSFYFLAAFRGKVFEHLKELGVNLYGAHVVRQTLTAGGSLPRWDFPVHSLTMTGSCICFTGLSSERREARRMNLPIILPTWIEKAWEASQGFSTELFTSKEITEQYKTPMFNKMVISATGVGGGERVYIARLIELNGGKFSGDMKRNDCTHLIADQAKGVKYKKAREWNTIKIVRSAWLRKSIAAGYILPESAFDPERRNRCSTPIQESRLVEQEELDCSSIQGKGGRLDSSSFSTQITPREDESKYAPFPLSAVRSSLRREPSRHRLAVSTPTKADPIDQLEESNLISDFDFLEGCRVWVCGAEQSRADKWKKILDRSGATRVAGMEAASHIIVVNSTISERRKLMQARFRGVHVVRAEWVSACYEQKDQVAVEDFLWDPEDVTGHTSSLASAPNLDGSPQACSQTVEPEPTPKQLGASDYLNFVPLCNVSDDPDLSSIFRGLKFRVHCSNETVATQTTKDLRCAGGKVVQATDETTYADYNVCDRVDFGQTLSKQMCFNAVTTFWVKRCMMDYRVLKPSTHPLFRPLPAVMQSEVFSSVVVVVSGFTDYERFTIAALVREFGGEVRETLIRRSGSDQPNVTHVIGGSEGDRVIEARRQKLKVVDPSWVIESIINDKLMKEEQFPLRGEAYASYVGRTDDLWPRATRAAPVQCSSEFNQISERESSESKFSDPFENGLHVAGVTPQRARTTQRNTEDALEVLEASSPISAIPSRLSVQNFNDRTLDLKKLYRPNFQGLTQVVDEFPSPGTTSADTSSDSLTTFMVGKILKEVAVKTATVKPDISEPAVPASSVTSEPPCSLAPRSGPKLRQRRSLTKRSESKPVSSAATEPSSGDMMSLRVKIAEKLEQRNREFANQVAENNSASRGVISSERTTQGAGSVRSRKRYQTGSDVEPSSKRPSQSSGVDSLEPKTAHPLIEWQPAMPRRIAEGEPAPVAHHKRADRLSRSTVRCPRSAPPPSHAASAAASCSTFIGSRAPEGAPVLSYGHVRRTADEKGSGVQARVQEKGVIADETEQASKSHRGSNAADSADSLNRERVSVNHTAIVRRFIFTSDDGIVHMQSVKARSKRYHVNTSSHTALQDRLRLSNSITQLGGIADFGELSDNSTHLICGKLIRGSKLMGCIASGRWVLNPDYVDKCLAAGKWLPRNGAFSDWRCTLYCTQDKAVGLVPLLKAGGAEVAICKDDSADPLAFRPTHVIVCSSELWNPGELEKLISVNAKVFQLDYISRFLIDEDVDEAASYHVDYAKFVNVSKR
ncbi:hypothetical protein Q1695_009265 [Nippostrongylus brasiliensis]|nr:hypothetical protein Q1695_009265 [Nippostrongylus brasiliensis]